LIIHATHRSVNFQIIRNGFILKKKSTFRDAKRLFNLPQLVVLAINHPDRKPGASYISLYSCPSIYLCFFASNSAILSLFIKPEPATVTNSFKSIVGGAVKSMLLYSLYKQIIRYKFRILLFLIFFIFTVSPANMIRHVSPLV
jgi:hypothetical protein